MIVEVAYDFFTMPESELTMEVAPFVMSINDFEIRRAGMAGYAGRFAGVSLGARRMC